MEHKLRSEPNFSNQITAPLSGTITTDSLEQQDRERLNQIWAERAAKMAKVNVNTALPGKQVTVVIVRLGHELVGLEAQYVLDIRPREAITRIPRVPGFFVGVTNLHGKILSVIDLRKYLGLPDEATDSPNSEPGLLILVQADGIEAIHTIELRNARARQNDSTEIVILVDDVPGVETLLIRDDISSSDLTHSPHSNFFRNMVDLKAGTGAKVVWGAQQHLNILDITKLLADSRLIIHEEMG